MLRFLRVSCAAVVCVAVGLPGQGQPPSGPPVAQPKPGQSKPIPSKPAASQSGTVAPTVFPPRPSIRLLEIEGTPKDRGLAHGRAFKKEIRELLGLFKKDLAARYRMPADEFITRFRQDTEFEAAALKWTPKLVQELHGIASGAEVDYDTLFVFQLVDEIWAQGRVVVADGETAGKGASESAREVAPAGKRTGEKCTSIGVDRAAGAPTLVAQNLDIPEFYHGYQTVLHIKEGKGKTRLQTFVVTVPGLLAMNGMNDQGIGVAVNTMLQLRPCPDGLPVAFVVRGLLERRTFPDARKFLYTVRHASGQNYLLGGRDVAHSFECSAQRVVRYVPPGRGRVWHTNHPLVSDDWAPRFRAQAETAGVEPKAQLRECPRFAALGTRFADAPAPTASDLVGALKDRLAGRDGISNRMTFAATLMLLGGDDQLRITAGAPDQGPFFAYRFPEERKMRKSEK